MVRMENRENMMIANIFGYEIHESNGTFNVLNGEGDIVQTANSSFEAKKWCKSNKTSDKWRADGKWDWNR